MLRTTLTEILQEEADLTTRCREHLGAPADLVLETISLLNSYIVRVDSECHLAASSHIALQKNGLLAFLGYARRHTAQAEFHIRQVTEFAALCAYFLAHPHAEVLKEGGGFRDPKAVTNRAYRWLEAGFPDHNRLLHDAKLHVNNGAVHASVYSTHFTFDWSHDGPTFEGFYFDRIEKVYTQHFLCYLSNLTLLVISIMTETSKEYGGFEVGAAVGAQTRSLTKRLVSAHAEVQPRLQEALRS